jgi:hypothetical protein
MADCLANLGHSLETFLGHLGVPGVHGFDAALYVFGGALLLWVCFAVSAVIRTAQRRDSLRNQRRHSVTTAELAHAMRDI